MKIGNVDPDPHASRGQDRSSWPHLSVGLRNETHLSVGVLTQISFHFHHFDSAIHKILRKFQHVASITYKSPGMSSNSSSAPPENRKK